MNLARHELELSKTKGRFPLKDTCLQIYSRVVNAQQPLGTVLKEAFPWCAEWEEQLKRLFASYVEAKQRQMLLDYDDLLLYWHQAMLEPDIAADIALPPSTMCWSTNTRIPIACRPRSSWRSSPTDAA